MLNEKCVSPFWQTIWQDMGYGIQRTKTNPTKDAAALDLGRCWIYLDISSGSSWRNKKRCVQSVRALIRPRNIDWEMMCCPNRFFFFSLSRVVGISSLYSVFHLGPLGPCVDSLSVDSIGVHKKRKISVCYSSNFMTFCCAIKWVS
jgi:hypothetical protein